jgi:hypothetical protein
MRRMKVDLHLKIYTNINSRCIEDLNVRSEVIKLPKEKTWGNLCDIVLSDDFWTRIQK